MQLFFILLVAFLNALPIQAQPASWYDSANEPHTKICWQYTPNVPYPVAPIPCTGPLGDPDVCMLPSVEENYLEPSKPFSAVCVNTGKPIDAQAIEQNIYAPPCQSGWYVACNAPSGW